MNCVIVTFHSELNYGAVLQAYALQAYLGENNQAKVLDFRMKKNRNIKDFITGNIFTIIKKYKFKRFIKQELDLTKKVFNVNETQKEIKQFDYVIVGSDQVWAFDLIKGYEQIYYLDMNLEETKKVSYAASFGKDETIVNHKEAIQKYLEKFYKISTREESSSKILNTMEISCTDVIDPTLLLSKEEYIKKFHLVKQEKRYILVYMLTIDETMINIVKQISERLNMDIICFNNRNRFGKRGICVPNSGPKEFVNLFYNASFVVTNSFHGTCFSIIFRKPFISFAHETKGVRQINLLRKAGLEDRIYSEDKDIESYLNKELQIKEDLDNYIDKSKKFLDELK